MAAHRENLFSQTVFCRWFMLETWAIFIMVLTTLSGCGVSEKLEAGMGGHPGNQISTNLVAESAVALFLPAPTCTDPAQCKSGFCVDGVCCNAACAGTCQACTAKRKGGGVDGICENIGNGLDPDNECVAGECNGLGTCGSSPGPKPDGAACANGPSCASGICQNGVCCMGACAAVDECHAAGCVAGTGECIQMDRPDESLCNDGDACTFGDTCQQGVCVAGAPLVCPGATTCSNGTCSLQCAPQLGAVSDTHELPTPKPNPTSPPSGPDGAVADFNGDGVADLAISNATNATVSVYLNGGDGIAFSGPFSYATGTNPGKIFVADYNGDGARDMLVKITGAVSVLLNNGTGSFGPKVDTASVFPNTTGDFNGDGRADVAGYGGSGFNVWLSAGNGTFLPAVTYGVGVSGNTYNVVAGDFDGDGDTDLAAAVQHFSGPHSIRMSRNNGNGTFGTSVHLGYMANNTDYAFGMFAADWNGDGADDLAVGSASTRRVYMFTTTGMGSGSWGYLSSYGINVSKFAAADMNGDGLLDLGLMGVAATATVWLNNGNGTFDEVQADTHGPATAINLADLNGDGAPELIMSTHYVLFNNGDGHFGNAVSYGPTSGGRDVIIADLNADGWQDVAVANYLGNSIGVMMNTGNGVLAPMVNYATDVGPFSLVATDLNGDGALDLASANAAPNVGTVSVLLNNGGGTFAPKVDYAVVASLNALDSADLNGDGFMDLALVAQGPGRVYVLINLGNGTFGSPINHYTWMDDLEAIVVEDLNGDGLPDLAVVDQSDDDLGVLINTGNGTFAAPRFYSIAGDPRAMTAADLTGDGFLDLAVATYPYLTVTVFPNMGNGTFAAPHAYSGGMYSSSITTADFNGDGLVDVGTANSAGASASVFLNMGNGVLAPKVDYVTGNNPHSIAAGDLNNDGTSDLAVSNERSQTVSLLFNTCVP